MLALMFILIGLIQLYSFLARGYVAITPGGIQPGEHYTGALAVMVIVVSFGIGFLGLGYVFRAWRLYQRSRRDDTNG